MHKRRILALAFALAALSAVAGTARAQAAQSHTAFTLSNAVSGNRVIVSRRPARRRWARGSSLCFRPDRRPPPRLRRLGP